MAVSDVMSRLDPESRKVLDSLLAAAAEGQDVSAILNELYTSSGDYERVPVDIDTFLEDDYFLGASVRNLHENWRRELREIFAPASTITKLILTGAIGTGKTTLAAVCLARKIYELSCLMDPAAFFGLLPRSKIVFGIYSILLEKASDISELVKQYVDASPYFREACPRKARPTDPVFFESKNLEISTGSLSHHALGDNVLGYVLDEANFYRRVKNADNPAVKTRAYDLYNEANSRIVSRFKRRGVVPGFCILISSRKFQSSFLDELIEAARTNPDEAKTTKIVSFALWQTKPDSDFCGEVFQVLVGSPTYCSRVLEPDEVPPDGADVVVVPVEYLPQFRADADLALRDIAGISTAGSRNFFSAPERIRACIDPMRKHPFSRPMFSIPNVQMGDARTRISDFCLERELCNVSRGVWIPRVSPNVPREVHIDLAYRQEHLGFAMGHPSVTWEGLEGVYMDIMLSVVPPPGDETDISCVIDFILWLRQHGFQIQRVTFDQYQSRMPIQLLIQAGFTAELLSVQLVHYQHLKQAYHERRVMMYEYAPLLEEHKHLLRSEEDGKRPNHDEGFTDDISDAVAAVVSRCYKVERNVKRGKPPEDRMTFPGTVKRWPDRGSGGTRPSIPTPLLGPVGVSVPGRDTPRIDL